MSEFKVIRNISAKDFLKMNESLLRKNITLNNFFLGYANQILNGNIKPSNEAFFTIFQRDKIIGQAVNTDKEHNLLVTKMTEKAVPFIANELIKHRSFVYGVGGEETISYPLAMKLADIWNKKIKLKDHLGIYELSKVLMPDSKDLSLLHQDYVSKDLLFEWVMAFIKECDLNPNVDFAEEAKNVIARHETLKGFYFLINEDREVVSMAAKHREFEDRATISLVYTPPQFRRRGYGKIVTALLTKKLLDGAYVQCNLFTDLANPTSNQIYKEVGYEYIGDSKSFVFI